MLSEEEKRIRRNARATKWRNANRDKVRESARKSYRKHRKRRLEDCKAYRERTNYHKFYRDKNREKINAGYRRRVKEKYEFLIQEGLMTDCIICGFPKERYEAIDFHHIDPSIKKKEVATLVSRQSIEKFIKEVEKCVCMCTNCHRQFHAGREDIIQKYNEVVKKKGDDYDFKDSTYSTSE